MLSIDSLLAADLQRTVNTALDEDVGSGDLTARLVPVDATAEAVIISRQQAILCGCAWLNKVYMRLDTSIKIIWLKHDGDLLTPNQPLCRISGPARALLTGERTALNFLQTLSATATLTHSFVERIKGTGASILDTRKTVPGLRRAQKFAVRCGGGSNHRMGLYDAILIKENHILAAGSIKDAVHQAKAMYPGVQIEVETETLEEVQQALDSGSDIIMLDNFDLPMMRNAVNLAAGKVKLEVSGNVSLEAVRDIAETGVDFISIGALTKNIDAIDLSMRFNQPVNL